MIVDELLGRACSAGEHGADMPAPSSELLGEVAGEAAGPFPSGAWAGPGRLMQDPPLLSAGSYSADVSNINEEVT